MINPQKDKTEVITEVINPPKDKTEVINDGIKTKLSHKAVKSEEE